MSIPETTVLALEANTAAIDAFLESLSEEQAAQRPYPGKWNILEVMEHICTSEFGTIQVMRGEKTAMERDPEAKVVTMRTSFADDGKSFQAPAQLAASGRYATLSEAKAAFSKARGGLLQAAQEGDPNLGCASFPHPGFGLLSQLEWVHFSIIHADRHLRQMQHLASA